jgi:hypothetical protein
MADAPAAPLEPALALRDAQRETLHGLRNALQIVFAGLDVLAATITDGEPAAILTDMQEGQSRAREQLERLARLVG